MDKGIPTLEEVDSQGDQALPGADPALRRKPAGRKPNPTIDIARAAISAAGIAQKAFPWLTRRFATLPDPRRQDMCRYSGEHIWWSGTLLFLTRAGSRNAFDQARNSGEAPFNMGAFCGQAPDDPRFDGEPTITCSDNIAHHLRRIDPACAQRIAEDMVADLLPRRVLDSARLLDSWYLLVVDGTVQELCRRGFDEGGKSGGKDGARYRYVLQCGLLGPSNTFFPLMHEHVDLHDPQTQKEDCELRAFARLAQRLKKRFPRLRFCIIGDALFCTEAIAELCAKHQWKYVLTLKEGRQPTLWEEVLALLPLVPGNTFRLRTGQDGKEGLRDFRWVENLPLGRNTCTVVLLGEITPSAATLYAYATNLLISKDRVEPIISATGRQRHLIEDYFNTAKNNGVGLEHVFCADATASKNFFTLMQIAWTLWNFICHGGLTRLFEWAARATQKALAHAIAEGMRSRLFPPILPAPGQFRFG
jgi:hypothetical protein